MKLCSSAMFDYFAISNFNCVCSFRRISACELIAIDSHFWQVFVQAKEKLFGNSIIDNVDVDSYTISTSALKRGDASEQTFQKLYLTLMRVKSVNPVTVPSYIFGLNSRKRARRWPQKFTDKR